MSTRNTAKDKYELVRDKSKKKYLDSKKGYRDVYDEAKASARKKYDVAKGTLRAYYEGFKKKCSQAKKAYYEASGKIVKDPNPVCLRHEQGGILTGSAIPFV